MQHQEGTFRAAEQTDLYYQSWQTEGQAKAVLVIVHGLGEHGGRYGNVVQALAPQGYAIYALDQRGHGRSPGQRGYIKQWQLFIDDLHAFVQFVQGREAGRPFFIMGHSLGGNITLNYALQHPAGLQGVIASAPALDTSDVPPMLAFMSKVLYKIKPNLSVKVGLDVSGISRDTAVVEAYLADPLVHDQGSPGAAIAFSQSVATALSKAATFQPPLLMVHGDADRVVKIKSSHNFYPLVPHADKQLIIYPGGYHESHNDLHKEQLFADLLGWLEAHIA